jgi:hypothetical protein
MCVEGLEFTVKPTEEIRLEEEPARGCSFVGWVPKIAGCPPGAVLRYRQIKGNWEV